MHTSRRTSSSAISNNSTTYIEEPLSDPDASSSPSPSNVSSRTASPGAANASSRKNRTSGLRLSLKNLRTPKSASHVPTEHEQSPDAYQPYTAFERRTSLDLPSYEGRTSFDSIDHRRREHLASALPQQAQLSSSAPKSSTSRFSFLHSPTPSTPTMGRPPHQRSNTTPLNSPRASTNGASPRRTAVSPSPQPVKETHTMMKDYDPMTGNKMINKYMVVRELGRGVHGKVKLCRDTETNELCAIKIMDKTTRRRLGRAQISNEQKIRREVAIMKKCIHPNVVRLIEVIDDPNARKIYLVLEFMDGGEVRWKDHEDKPTLPLNDARTIFRDVVLGLEYLHMQGIIHRDIKPANLLLASDGSVKISDFGVSHFSEKNSLEHDLDSSPAVGKGFHSSPAAHALDSIFRHSAPHSPVSSSFSNRGHLSFGGSAHQDQYSIQHQAAIAQHQQWGDDLELAKTAGSPAFFAPELCYASEFSPAMSPTLSTASQTSFIFTPPTPRTNSSNPLGTTSSQVQTYTPRPPITKAIDIWALGVTLYCFVYGRCPFIADTEFELFNMIPRKKPEYFDSVPGRDYVCPELKDLLSRLLEKDVAKRITLKEVKEHPWVVEDLNDPERWRIETDPGNYQRVHVTEDDLKGAVTIIDKIKNRIRKLSVSLSNFTINRRRSKSISSTYTPDSPTNTEQGPITIIRSPIPTTSHSSTYAMAQPQPYLSPLSLPERFQHFHSNSSPGGGHNFGPHHRDRPNSVCSNTSSIDEVDEGDEHSGSGSSAQNNTSYVGRRRILRTMGQQHHHGSYEPRPPSIVGASFLTDAGNGTHFASSSSAGAWKSYSDDQLDHTHPYGSLSNNSSSSGGGGNGGSSLHHNGLTSHTHHHPHTHGLYNTAGNRASLGGASFSGASSARVVPAAGQSGLSKSWVYSPIAAVNENEASVSKHAITTTIAPQTIQAGPQQRRLSHRTSTLSPSSTLVSDTLHEQVNESQEQNPKQYLDSIAPQNIPTAQGL
ncbi:hypothetical protein BGZ94_006455 [Podila epigama]|nr:hypothetical protein BGZ94_006455 [Podila epigama]